MAIVIANLGNSTGTTEQAPDLRNVGDATSYQIASWNPPDDGLVVLCIINGQNTVTDIAIDSVTGNGDVWQEMFATDFNGGQRQLTIYAAFGRDLTTGATLIEFGTDTQLACYVSIFHVTGMFDNDIVSACFGAAEASSGTGTSASHNWTASPAGAGSRPLYWLGHVANEAVTQPGSLTKIDDMNGAGPALGVISAWEDDGFTDPSDSFTWTTSVAWGLLALEILEEETAAPEPVAWSPFPQVQPDDTKSGTQTSDSTSWTLTYPDNLEEGDLILAVMAVDGVISIPTFPANWYADRDGDAVSVTSVVAKKKALGTESGNFTVTLSAAEQGCWRVFRIRNWEGVHGTFWGLDRSAGSVQRVATSGSDAAPDPGNLNPAGWETEHTLWIVAGASDHGDTTYTGFPTSYTDTSAQESGGADGAALGIAMRHDLPFVSQNPSAFTTDVAEGWACQIIGVRPKQLRGYRRLYGPAHLGSAAATLFMLGSGMRCDIRKIDINNPTGGTVTATISIGTDAASTRVIEVPIPAGESRNLSRFLANQALTSDEFIQGKASTADALVCTIDGHFTDEG